MPWYSWTLQKPLVNVDIELMDASRKLVVRTSINEMINFSRANTYVWNVFSNLLEEITCKLIELRWHWTSLWGRRIARIVEGVLSSTSTSLVQSCWPLTYCIFPMHEGVGVAWPGIEEYKGSTCVWGLCFIMYVQVCI